MLPEEVKKILVAYIEYVLEMEGVDFLGDGEIRIPGLSPEQLAFLKRCRDEARSSDQKVRFYGRP